MSDHGKRQETQPSGTEQGQQNSKSEFSTAVFEQLTSLRESLEAGAHTLQQALESQTKNVKEFLTTMAPEIVKNHSVPRRYAIIFGAVMVIAVLINFVVSIYLAWDQSHNVRGQTAVQKIVERMLAVDTLSKKVDALKRVLADLARVKEAFSQNASVTADVYAFESVPGTSSPRKRDWLIPLHKFTGDFCSKTYMAIECNNRNIFELIKIPSLDLADGGQIQTSMILHMLIDIDEAVQPISSANTGSTTRHSISGILTDAQNVCESSSSALIDSSMNSNITQASFDYIVALSAAIDGVINASRAVSACYSRLQPDNQSPTLSLACPADSHVPSAAQIDAFRNAVATLDKEVKDSDNRISGSMMSVSRFTALVGMALVKVDEHLDAINADCVQRKSSFDNHVSALALKPADYLELVSQ